MAKLGFIVFMCLFVLAGCTTSSKECELTKHSNDHDDRWMRHHDQLQYSDHQRLEERLKEIEQKIDDKSPHRHYEGRAEGRH